MDAPLEILGNEPARELLARGLALRGPAPAYLFVGPRGVGKRLTGLWLASWLACRAPARPCGGCPACRRIAHGGHPDVRVQAREEGKASLGIEEIRQGIREVQLASYEGGHRIWLVPEAERLTEEAQSALLKTLEEPPDHLVLILVAGSEEALLPTVASRCRRLRFAPLAPALVEGLLVRRGVPEDRAAVLARVAAGSPGVALGLAEQAGLWELREEALEAGARLPGAGMGEALEIAAALEALKIGKGEGRADHERALEALLSWFRDLLVWRVGAGEELLVNRHRRDRIARAAGSLPPGRLEGALSAILEASRLLSRNVNPRLLWQKLCLTLSDLPAPGGG